MTQCPPVELSIDSGPKRRVFCMKYNLFYICKKLTILVFLCSFNVFYLYFTISLKVVLLLCILYRFKEISFPISQLLCSSIVSKWFCYSYSSCDFYWYSKSDFAEEKSQIDFKREIMWVGLTQSHKLFKYGSRCLKWRQSEIGSIKKALMYYWWFKDGGRHMKGMKGALGSESDPRMTGSKKTGT
jgi:hypothetical protein